MDVRRLEGRVAIVTGASRGIGRAVALAFAREGAKVVVAAKSEVEQPHLPGTIHSVAREVEALGGEAMPVRLDVRHEDEVDAMVRATRERWGRVDILVNNAGALWWRPLLETPASRFDLVMGVNFRAAHVCTRAVLPAMLESGHGHVLVFSPPVEMALLPGKIAYMVSKFGMTMLAMGLAEELRGRNVAVNALWPATLVETRATINYGLGGPAMWRKPEIMGDAALEVVSTPPAELTGRMLIDEDFLRTRGWTDFSRYRSDPAVEPPRVTVVEWPEAGGTPADAPGGGG